MTDNFDINNPIINDYVPDIDPDFVPGKTPMPAPPDDGIHKVKARLRALKDKENPYRKDPEKEGDIPKIIAAIDCRILNPDGSEGAFLKTWYATTGIKKGPKGEKGSDLTAICTLTGNKVPPGAGLETIKNYVSKVFRDAGDAGIELMVETKWEISLPKIEYGTGPDGEAVAIGYQFKSDGSKDYEKSIKGQANIIKKQAAYGVEGHMAHISFDPVSGEEIYARAVVENLRDPKEFA